LNSSSQLARTALSIGFISLGCAKNLVDTEHMAAVLRAQHVPLAPSPDAADIIVINTCGFIGDAKAESLEAILAACARKRAGRCRSVIVAGCLAQRYQRQLPQALAEVDAFIGLDEVAQIGDIIRRLEGGERRIRAISRGARKLFDPLPERPLFTGGPFAYVKIAEGCNHRCGFCVIPLIRGRYRSRTIDSIVREAEALLARGVRELNLIAQDTTAYGSDAGDGTNLARLVRSLGRIGGSFWIRLLYGFPTALTDELLDAMATTPQVCRYLDLPIQHSHPDILRAMRRGYSAHVVATLPVRLRRVLPGAALRTTCLVGYPGETEAHFQHLLQYLEQAEFDHVGVFAFSLEENTAAARLPRRVPSSLAEARRTRLMQAQSFIVKRRARQRCGQTAEFLLENRIKANRHVWIGRSRSQAPEVDGVTRIATRASGLKPGDLIAAEYTGYSGYDLRARQI
jgi:ribosomal protein S12 methylthiotransferase